MSKRKGSKGFTSQGLRDLNHIKGKSVGVRLEMPPGMEDESCDHPDESLIALDGGKVKCTKCNVIQ